MNDTPKHIRDLILSKTPHERAMMGIYMMESVYNIVRNSIKQQHPKFTKQEVTAAVFMRYYGHEFSNEEAEKITEHLISVMLKMQ